MSHFIEDVPITRREALRRVGATAAVAAFTGIGCESVSPGAPARAAASGSAGGAPSEHASASEESGGEARAVASRSRMPAVFLPHGGGPWPFVETSFGAPDMWARLEAYLRDLAMVPPRTPDAVLCISAHWEEPVPTVQTAQSPPMLYDYYGFPEEAYALEWPAPGHLELAGRVRELLESAGIRSGQDGTRGFDHGTFVPLKLTYPAADIPTLQLSLKRGLDPAEHLAIGRALTPLRDTGVFVVGSGMSYHNMRGFRRGAGTEDSRRFDDWLGESMDLDPSRRETRLVEWEHAPAARACHPREEHLLPLMVVAGTAAEEVATVPFSEMVMGVKVSAVHFG
jgi:aromatic ring-opening dioxygenase catalytic subunit (LigB family)